jgi:hypothetical protein
MSEERFPSCPTANTVRHQSWQLFDTMSAQVDTGIEPDAVAHEPGREAAVLVLVG